MMGQLNKLQSSEEQSTMEQSSRQQPSEEQSTKNVIQQANLTPGNINLLHLMIRSNKPIDAITKVFKDCKKDINAVIFGATALSLTLYHNRMDVFDLILNESDPELDIRSKDKNKRIEPPIVTACRQGKLDASTRLLEGGCDTEGVDDVGHTALWLATRQRYPRICALLIRYGANVNPSVEWNRSPLYVSLKFPRRTDITELFVYHGADVRIKGEHKFKSLLYWAMFHDSLNMVKVLANAGVNITTDGNIQNNQLLPAFAQNDEFQNWLQQELKNPPSLYHHCRIVIRRKIQDLHEGSNFLKNLNKLPLPSKVINYIALKDIIAESKQNMV
ncbi:unnamed protein product, partial [Owenia fusiformis]